MADIRINALATTATTPASDDYLALDGTAQGTRKILATNIANNVTDVILGSSGPSVKSSLSARAPRQGLVFDGTAGATVSVPAFGQGTAGNTVNDFTVVGFGFKSALTRNEQIVGGANNSFGLIAKTDGTLITDLEGFAANGASTGTFTAGKNTMFVYVRSGITGTYYINGVAAGTITDNQNYSVGCTIIGGSTANANSQWTGTLSVLIYNRALSASEVVSLYEAGAPAGADYPGTAAGNSLSTSAFSGTRWGASYSVFSGASATGFHAERASGGGDDSVTSDSFTVKKGDIIRCVFDMTNSADLPYIYLGDASTGAQQSTTLPQTTAGSAQVFLLTASAAGSVRVAFYTSNAQTANYTVANFTALPLGLLLAPDAAQAGGGLVWYDTSGNAANITLPASGVSWNVPSSRVLGGNWSVSGTYNGTSGLLNIGTGVLDAELVNLAAATDGVGLSLLSTKTGGRRYFIVSSGGTSGYGQGKLVFGDETVGAYMALASTGNFLLGKTIDSSNGRLQLADHTTSAGGIGFGTGMALYLTSTYDISLDALAGNPILRFRNAGTEQFRLESSGSQAYFTASNSIIMRSAGVTALTLDSSQNATFAGDVYIASGKVLKGNGNLYLDSVSSNVIIRPAGSEMVSIDNALTTLSNKLCISNAVTPASASATGTTGTIVWDASYIYVCTATNTWKRVAIATW